MVLAACGAGNAGAADSTAAYPSRPVRIVVPAATGGSTDPIARMIGQKLGDGWGRPVVIDNRPGAATNLGTEIVAKAQPDGHTLLVTTSSVAINLHLYRKQGYHPQRDLAPVSLVCDSPLVLVVHPSVPAKSLAELIEHARANRGKLSYASSGAGSNNHLAIELLKTITGVDLLHVPFKGGGPAVTEMASGRVQVMAASTLSVLGLVRADRLRMLAVTTPRRNAQLPEVPAIAETFPGFDFTVWYGMMAPAGTPAGIIRKLNAEVVKILALPDVKERLAGVGVDTTGSTPEAFALYLAREIGKFEKIIKASGATAE
jgi:tripartite-type tricarboxylate transporter receptor subunit TctC